MILRPDCRHFPGDRPCLPHKNHGIHCDACTQFEPTSQRILIIKLDAVGDVLRTTCILQGLKERHPHSQITWVTQKESVPIFYGNKMVERVLAYDSMECTAALAVEKFDLLINLDAAPKSALLASYAGAKTKLGYGVNEQGKVFCWNREAETWLEMGAFDDIKRRNTRSYQQLMLEICGLKPLQYEIQVTLTESELLEADGFRRRNGISEGIPVIGLNTGAGSRWEMKKWTFEGYRSLIRRIIDGTPYQIVLYGAGLERERNLELAKGHTQRVTIADTEKSLRQFFALLDISDVVVTGDTLALHAATALQKRVIAIFGPTSAPEIETYNRVRKVVSDTMECKCYYRPVCDQEVNCMNTIPAERIFAMVQEEAAKVALK